jgi:hypothetical protein
MVSTSIFDDLGPFIGQPIAIEIWRFWAEKIGPPMLEIKSKELICNHLHLTK